MKYDSCEPCSNTLHLTLTLVSLSHSLHTTHCARTPHSLYPKLRISFTLFTPALPCTLQRRGRFAACSRRGGWRRPARRRGRRCCHTTRRTHNTRPSLERGRARHTLTAPVRAPRASRAAPLVELLASNLHEAVQAVAHSSSSSSTAIVQIGATRPSRASLCSSSSAFCHAAAANALAAPRAAPLA